MSDLQCKCLFVFQEMSDLQCKCLFVFQEMSDLQCECLFVFQEMSDLQRYESEPTAQDMYSGACKCFYQAKQLYESLSFPNEEVGGFVLFIVLAYGCWKVCLSLLHFCCFLLFTFVLFSFLLQCC